jgi:hypothetical protein
MANTTTQQSIEAPLDRVGAESEPLKGHSFYQFEKGTITRYGMVLRQWDQCVLVEHSNWVTGLPTRRHILRVSNLVWDESSRTGFFLYVHNKDWVFSSYAPGEVSSVFDPDMIR